jgi:hypothetical protein
MTRILSIEAAMRYNVHGERKSIGRAKITKLRTLPMVPKIMNVIKTTFAISAAMSNNIFDIEIRENCSPIYSTWNTSRSVQRKEKSLINFNQSKQT